MASNILDNGVEIEGTIKFTGDLTLDCKVNGEIQSNQGNLILKPNSSVKGDIKANQVVIHGKIEGSLEAQSCKFESTADVNGDLSYKTISMEPGAKMIGSTKMIS